MMISPHSIEELNNFVRQHDPDRYLLSMFAPKRHRQALLALAAFNYEIAKTREVVSETQIGLIRLQWWQDALEEMHNGLMPREHDVVQALAQVIKTYDLQHDSFKNLIYAREFDLEDVQPANIEGLRNYTIFTHHPLLEMTAYLLGAEENSEELKNLASFYALIGVLRAMPHHHGQVRYMLPQNLCVKYTLKNSKLHTDKEREKLKSIIVDILGDIYGDKYMYKPVEGFKHPYFRRMYILACEYHKALKKCDFDPFLAEFSIKKRRFLTISKVFLGI